MQRILFLGLFLFLWGCEPDDICSDSTQTTSRLVIEFYDIENLTDTKTVPGLYALGLDSNGNEVTIYGETVNSTSRIALPLNGNQNNSTFILYKNYNEVNGVIEGNADVISVNYTTQAVYVSRACGYKNLHTIQSFEIETDSDMWMVFSSISNYEIVNENITHVEIFH